MQLDEDMMKRQEKFSELIEETGNKIVDMAEYVPVELVLVDFIGNLIDYCLAGKIGGSLYAEYKSGDMTRDELYKAIDALNLRPRYKEKVRVVIDEMINNEEREVV